MTHQNFKLTPFDGTPPESGPLPEISGVITRSHSELRIEYGVSDAAKIIQWPLMTETEIQSGTTHRKDNLWQKTCLELFIRSVDKRQYREFNFSSDASWNCYRFEQYRSPIKREEDIQSITCSSTQSDQKGKQQTTVTIKIPLPKSIIDEHWSVGLCAVLEDKSGRLHYYALTHNPDKPDFHAPETHTLTLSRIS